GEGAGGAGEGRGDVVEGGRTPTAPAFALENRCPEGPRARGSGVPFPHQSNDPPTSPGSGSVMVFGGGDQVRRGAAPLLRPAPASNPSSAPCSRAPRAASPRARRP